MTLELVDWNRKARFGACEGIGCELLWSTGHKIERLYRPLARPQSATLGTLANVPYYHAVGLFEVER
ncbi:hypothetical protein SS05631_c13640 [Sinorhizobium sp. CCBAU 05631]|nr:hypothetical protein SS05631_c13640 [Sinorhizobium sp. CCBAU 05631]